MAGSAHTHIDNVFANGTEPELAIEAGHSEHPGEGDAHLLRDLFERHSWQVTVGLLSRVKRFHQA